MMEDLDYLGPDDDRIDHNSAITDEEFIKLRTQFTCKLCSKRNIFINSGCWEWSDSTSDLENIIVTYPFKQSTVWSRLDRLLCWSAYSTAIPRYKAGLRCVQGKQPTRSQ